MDCEGASPHSSEREINSLRDGVILATLTGESKSNEGFSNNTALIKWVRAQGPQGERLKGVWECQTIPTGRGLGRHFLCGLWQIHDGHPGTPLRVDVHCDRCGTRHQHRPNPVDHRGKVSRIRYVRFPDDVDLDILLKYARMKNWSAGGVPHPEHKVPVGFTKATDL